MNCIHWATTLLLAFAPLAERGLTDQQLGSQAAAVCPSSDAQLIALAEAYLGTITRIDEKAKSIDVFIAADKKTTTFALRKDTKVTLDGRVAAIADLKAGFSVEVTAKTVGKKLVATAIIARKVSL